MLAHACAVLLGACLSACTVFPPASFPGSGPTPVAAPRAAPGASRASPDSAAALEASVSRAAPADQAGLQLQAARAWLRAGRSADATRVLNSISGPLTANQNSERSLIEADLLLQRGQAQQAWQKLSAIPEPTGTPLAPQYFDSRLRIALAAARPVDGVRAEMAAERLAGSAGERSALRSQLLVLLRQAREHGVKLEAEASQDATVRGWLELGAMASGSAGDSNALGGAGASISGATEAATWRSRYPGHPAAELLPSALPAALTWSGKVRKLALLLPVSGGAAGFAAIVHSGFDYAYQQLPADTRPQLRVYDTAALSVSEAFNQARSEGCDFIIGPLTRAEVDAAAATNVTVPTLVLNNVSAGRVAPAGLYQFALSPEEEARVIAQRLLAAGQKRGVALTPSSDWGNRVLAAFSQELQSGGGTLVAQATYDPGAHDFGTPIRTVLATDQSFARRQRLETLLGLKLEFEPRSRADLDFVFAPGAASNLRLLRPQLRFQYAGEVPVYATSDAYAVDGGVANQDLEGLIIPAMPWLVPNSGDADTVRQAVQAAAGSSTAWQSGLYAFGYDALQMGLALGATGRNHEGLRVAGLTGQLSVDGAGRVHRQPVWARIDRKGEPQIMASTGPVLGRGSPAGDN